MQSTTYINKYWSFGCIIFQNVFKFGRLLEKKGSTDELPYAVKNLYSSITFLLSHVNKPPEIFKHCIFVKVLRKFIQFSVFFWYKLQQKYILNILQS
jgi:hypothetical protein